LLVSLTYPQLRDGKPAPELGFEQGDPDLRLLWDGLRKLGLSAAALGELVSAGIQYAEANYLQRAQAFTRKGGELPAHSDLKSQLGMSNTAQSKKRLEEIAIAEADRSRWSDRKVTTAMRTISAL